MFQIFDFSANRGGSRGEMALNVPEEGSYYSSKHTRTQPTRRLLIATYMYISFLSVTVSKPAL